MVFDDAERVAGRYAAVLFGDVHEQRLGEFYIDVGKRRASIVRMSPA